MRLVKIMVAVAALSATSAPVYAGGMGVMGTSDQQVQVPPVAPRGGNGKFIWVVIGGVLTLVALGAGGGT